MILARFYGADGLAEFTIRQLTTHHHALYLLEREREHGRPAQQRLAESPDLRRVLRAYLEEAGYAED